MKQARPQGMEEGTVPITTIKSDDIVVIAMNATFSHGTLLEQMALLQQSFHAFASAWKVDAWSAFAGLSPSPAKAKRFERDHVLRELLAITREHPTHVSQARSTTVPDDSGMRCIQGELMLRLGFSRDELLPSSDIAWVFGLENDVTLHTILEDAEYANDQGVPWGEIGERISARWGFVLAA